MSQQLVVRVGNGLVEHVDALVDAGILSSRSEAVRIGLERLVRDLEHERLGAEIVAGYARIPETPEEIARADAAGRRLIEAEPW